jgi:hypothetical protein
VLLGNARRRHLWTRLAFRSCASATLGLSPCGARGNAGAITIPGEGGAQRTSAYALPTTPSHRPRSTSAAHANANRNRWLQLPVFARGRSGGRPG